MKIKTDSGEIKVRKDSHYTKWLQGWMAGKGWSGWYTLEKAWERAKKQHEMVNVSWHALGYLMATEQSFGGALEYRELKDVVCR